jgi:seryl-tRNA synthetase
MIDINFLRENTELVKEALKRKKFKVDVDAVLELDEKRRALITDAESAKAHQNQANKQMSSLDKKSDAFREKIQEMKSLALKTKELEQLAKKSDLAFQLAFIELPNLPDPSIPNGFKESDNLEVNRFGSCEEVNRYAIPHYDIPWFDEGVQFSKGTKVTGAGFPFYIGDIAKLVRGMIQFFLDEANDAGFIEFAPPILVNAASATATGQLPDKEGQMYFSPSDELYLIPTAEVPVTNYYRDEILDIKELPINHCAYTPCFRREAGSWGKEVRGLNRLHQFDKVEVVKWVEPSTSMDELEAIRTHSEGLLKQLGLPFRTLLMCAGDIGFPHSKQYDIEVWADGQERWLEVSSCSNFTDFQARRAGIRFRNRDGKVQAVHTLNGSALAIPRVLAAILENNLQDDGTVLVPEVLQDRTGLKTIGKVQS